MTKTEIDLTKREIQGGKIMKIEKPVDWPETLRVFDNGGAWSGLAIDPDDHPIHMLRLFLESMDDRETDPSEMWGQYDEWTEVEWDSTAGVYRGIRYGTADGKHTQHEIEYQVDSLYFFCPHNPLRCISER